MTNRIWIAAYSMFLTACAAGPDYQAPQNPLAEKFVRADAGAFSAAAPEHDWWQLLEDILLSNLIEKALVANNDIRVANANIRASRALLRLQRLDSFPTVSVSGSASRQQSSSALPATGDRYETFYDVGFDATWELDFFGRVSRTTEAALASHEAGVADQRTVAVTVAAEVARVYLELRGAQRQLDVAKQNAANQQDTLELTQSLKAHGRGSDLDVARAQSQVATTRAIQETLEVDVARAMHRLGVLVGQSPATLVESLATTAPLPTVPANIAIGDPASLLRRRPDILAAERRLAASTARIGVASADLFPRINLIGSIGTLATSGAALGDSDTARSTIGPFLSWAAFDLGRVRARISAADANAEAYLANYEQTVLVALEDTENALVAFARSANRGIHLSDAEKASARAVELARTRFRNGLDSFLSVLDAERRLLEAQSLLAKAETENALAFVSLYKALGGGWELLGDLST